MRQAEVIWREMGDWKSVGGVVGGHLTYFAFLQGEFDRVKDLVKEARAITLRANYPPSI